MKKFKVTYTVRDGLIKKREYTFDEEIEAENPREAFTKAKKLCSSSSGLISPKWEIDKIEVST